MRNRSVSDKILKRSTSKVGRILVLTGARQTGKTTLIKEMFPEYEYISIEDPVVVESYKSLTSAQWNQLYPMAILDEIQKEPQIVESIKAVYDQYKEARYVLLGSSQILLLKKIRESLAGRCEILELFPLTLPEMLTKSWKDEVALSKFQHLIQNNSMELTPFLLDKKHHEKQLIFDNYLQFGGYPALYDEELTVEDKRSWLNNYVRTYLERDIRDLAEFRSLEPFTKVQKLLAINSGQLMNFSKLAAEASISPKTAQRFLEYMAISYQTIHLEPWSRSKKKRLIKSPRIHFADIGILRAILQKSDELNGHEFESAIIAEIYKQSKARDFPISFYHLRTFDGKEVDLLLEKEDGYIAIEIKKSNNIRQTDGRNLRGLEEILDKPVLKKIILSNDLETKEFDNGVMAIPAVQFLS